MKFLARDLSVNSSRSSSTLARVFTALGVVLMAQSANAATLVVEVNNLETNEGKLNIAIYDSKKTWLDDEDMVDKQQLEVPEHYQDGSITTSFELPPGEYAISVHHDANDNGKMDTKIFPPIPKEPVGASNDAEPGFGPPKYKDAKFDLGEDGLTMPIRLMTY